MNLRSKVIRIASKMDDGPDKTALLEVLSAISWRENPGLDHLGEVPTLLSKEEAQKLAENLGSLLPEAKFGVVFDTKHRNLRITALPNNYYYVRLVKLNGGRVRRGSLKLKVHDKRKHPGKVIVEVFSKGKRLYAANMSNILSPQSAKRIVRELQEILSTI